MVSANKSFFSLLYAVNVYPLGVDNKHCVVDKCNSFHHTAIFIIQFVAKNRKFNIYKENAIKHSANERWHPLLCASTHINHQLEIIRVHFILEIYCICHFLKMPAWFIFKKNRIPKYNLIVCLWNCVPSQNIRPE